MEFTTSISIVSPLNTNVLSTVLNLCNHKTVKKVHFQLMAATAMSKTDEYRKYLKSGAWQEKRAHALDRTDGFCQFCGEPAENVHHVQYPKQLGTEHPNSLIPVCKRCHEISHGIQQMQVIASATIFSELTPNNSKLNYIVSGSRIYASARSWERALQIPKSLSTWFHSGLSRTAMLRKNFSGGALEAVYQDTPVYRWHAVAELLRAFDRNWYQHGYKSRPKPEQREIDLFHQNYEHLVAWGYDLQERALSNLVLNSANPAEPVSQEVLVDAINHAIAPRLQDHDNHLREHDVVISEIKEAMPSMRDDGEFITVRQAILEKGLDSTSMPLYPKSRDNLSGLTGQLLKEKAAEQGQPVVARIDGHSLETSMNTYRRMDIYQVLEVILKNSQSGFSF